MTRFQLQAISKHDGFVKGEPRLGAIPGDEIVYGKAIGSL